MKLFYWSPFLSNIATVDAVVNSVNSIKKYDKKKRYQTLYFTANQVRVNEQSYMNLYPKYTKMI